MDRLDNITTEMKKPTTECVAFNKATTPRPPTQPPASKTQKKDKKELAK